MNDMDPNDYPADATKVTLTCKVDELDTAGFAFRRNLATVERARRAARSFGILFVIGLFSVFVPLLHFVLPPLFLCAAIGFAVVTWLETSEVLGGSCTCPNCRKDIPLAHEAEDWPLTVRCPGCAFTLTITPAEAP